MISKKFEEIQFADVQQLIDNAIPESRTLDYKRDLPSDQDSDKREFLADVASLANAAGGDLIVGIADKKDANGKNTGTPEFFGLRGDINTDQEGQKLQNIIRDGIKPKIPLVQIKSIDADEEKKIAVIWVSKSWAAPHMVSFKTSPAFFSRTSTGKQPLDVHEIRNAFIGGEQVAQRIQDFRTERLGRLIADDLPCKMHSERKVVLHLVPYQSLDRGIILDLAPIYNNPTSLTPIYRNGFNRRYNLDGLFVYTDWGDKPNFAYLQGYRDGRMESVESYLVSPHGDKGELGIPFIALEKQLIDALDQYLGFYRSNEVGAPVAVMLSLLNIKGGYITPDRWRMDRAEPISEQHLILPEILLEDLNQPAEQILKPSFDALWNACGYEKCWSYGDDGKWRDISRGR